MGCGEGEQFFFPFQVCNDRRLLMGGIWMYMVRLITDREERYTTLQQVKDHPWFAGLDWTKLRDMVSLTVIHTPAEMEESQKTRRQEAKRRVRPKKEKEADLDVLVILTFAHCNPVLYVCVCVCELHVIEGELCTGAINADGHKLL